ncbi:MAG TPA: hypothetical protein VM165_11755 [Planctomycetaceae bacterium]|nr:hypothetical protein [Planctomycetaceae bacterium]
MDHSPPSSTDPPLPSGGVTPLTQVAKKSGDPYRRRADVEAEIAEHLVRRPATWVLKSPNSETLVYLVRWLRPTNDLGVIGAVVNELGRRITRIVRRYASGLSESEALEFAADVAAGINGLIFAATVSRQSEILEIAFHKSVKRHAINERAKIKNRKRRVVVETALGPAGDVEQDGLSVVTACPDEGLNPEERVLEAERHKRNPDQVRKALAAITNPQHRDAFVLSVIEGWPIASVDSQRPTLSTHFERTPRQIQTWLATARQEMLAALGDEI